MRNENGTIISPTYPSIFIGSSVYIQDCRILMPHRCLCTIIRCLHDVHPIRNYSKLCQRSLRVPDERIQVVTKSEGDIKGREYEHQDNDNNHVPFDGSSRLASFAEIRRGAEPKPVLEQQDVDDKSKSH